MKPFEILLFGFVCGIIGIFVTLVALEIKPDFEADKDRDVMIVEWVTDPEKVDAILTADSRPIVGKAFVSHNRCTVYAHAPEKIHDEKMMTVGHEMTHCFYGKYHE